MQHRTLGKTGLKVGEISLGTEYLKDVPREVTVSVVRTALERGVNYIDMFYGDPGTRDRFGEALEGRWDEVLFAGHLGAGVRDGKHSRIRGNDECDEYFHDLLRRLRTDHIGVVMLHWFDAEDDFGEHFEGLAELAQRYQREGKARLIGLSTHKVAIALKAIERGIIDVLMFPINLAGNAMPGRKEFLAACAARGVAVVAMKVYGGGKLLQRAFDLQGMQSGWQPAKKRVEAALTPPQCLGYALSQIGVCTAVPGPSSLTELDATFRYLEASPAERDFAGALSAFEEYREGECVYCNHCLPCPADIDIGGLMRLFDAARLEDSPQHRAAYEALPAKAADCVECGDCEERCPFGVEVIAAMKDAAKVFEQGR